MRKTTAWMKEDAGGHTQMGDKRNAGKWKTGEACEEWGYEKGKLCVGMVETNNGSDRKS